MPIPNLILPGGNPEYNPGLLPLYQGPLLPGSLQQYAKTNTASIGYQWIRGEGYSIRYGSYRFLESLQCSSLITSPGLYQRFQTRNSQRHIINEALHIHLQQDQCAGFYTGAVDCVSQFLHDQEYQCLDIYYAPSLLEPYEATYPELHNALTKSTADWIPGMPGWTSPEMQDVIMEILHCPFDDATRELYFDGKIHELLLLSLYQRYRRPVSNYHFTPWEVRQIHAVKEMLSGYLHSKPPSLPSLARKVNMSDARLKAGFNDHFHTDIFDWLMRAKMNHAKELLLQSNKPIKEIGSLIGYTRVSNFITGFRKQFGFTPGSLRR